MSSRPSFSLMRALSAAYASLPAAWGGAWLVLLLLWALGTFGGLMPVPHAFNAPVTLGIAVLMGIAKLMTQGALYRVALFGTHAKSEGLGFGGLQFGRPEWRLLAASLIVSVFALVIIATLFIVFAIAFDTAGMAEGYSNTLAAVHSMLRRHQGTDWVFIIYLIAALVFLIFVVLKFSLMQPATVAERRIVTLNAFGLTSGNVGKLFIGLITLLLPMLIILLGVLYYFIGWGMSFSASSAGISLYPWFLHAGLQAVAIFILLPLLAGFLSSAYRQIADLRAK